MSPLRGLKHLFEFDSGVVLLQYLIVRRAVQGHAEGADLAHSDAVAPALSVKRHADQIAASISLFVEVGEALEKAKKRTETQGTNARSTGSSQNVRADRTLR